MAGSEAGVSVGDGEGDVGVAVTPVIGVIPVTGVIAVMEWRTREHSHGTP